MSFAAPALLGFLGLLVPLGVLYVLHFRRPPVEVGSLMLWRGLRAPTTTGRKWHRLQTPLSLLLEAIAIAALAMLAAGPFVFGSIRAPLIVVLDDSMSMLAEVEGVSARDRAIERLEAELDASSVGAVAVVLAGARPTAVATEIDRPLALAAVRTEWSARASSADLRAAVAIGRTLVGDATRVLVLSDRAPSEDDPLDDLIRWVAVGEPAPNAGIAAAVRSPLDDRTDAIVLDVANPSDDPIVTTLTVRTEATRWEPSPDVDVNTLTQLAPFAESRLDLAPGEVRRLRVEVPATDRAAVCELSGDGLGADNRAVLVPVRTPPVRASVEGFPPDQDARLRRALEATGRVRLTDTAVELVLHRGAGPATPNAWGIEFREPPDEDAVAFAVNGFALDRDHPLSEGLAFDGVRWVYEPGWSPLGSVPVAFAGRDAVMVAFPDQPGRLALNIDLARSDLLDAPALPVLAWNLVAERLRARPGPTQRNIATGSLLTIGLDGAGGVRVSPDGVRTDLPASDRPLDVLLDQPGVHLVRVGDRTDRVAVNPTHRDESDLRAAVTDDFGSWPERSERDAGVRTLGWLFGLLAAAATVAHAFVVWNARRDRGGP